MIKWFRFAAPGQPPPSEVPAPAAVRPLRRVVCTALTDLVPQPPYPGLTIEWFLDRPHLEAHHRWLAESGPPTPPPATVVVAEELVARGADWLEQRWRAGGPMLKHMAVATRAAGLTTEEFADRWRGRAGTLRGDDGRPLVIPDEARGRAYVQNHPLAWDGVDAPVDAVNEVWFDDAASLRRRIEWFEEHLPGADEDLVSESWFLAVREEPAQDSMPRYRA